jgi:hypothetical protein
VGLVGILWFKNLVLLSHINNRFNLCNLTGVDVEEVLLLGGGFGGFAWHGRECSLVLGVPYGFDERGHVGGTGVQRIGVVGMTHTIVEDVKAVAEVLEAGRPVPRA